MTTSTLTDLSGTSGYLRVQWTNAGQSANWYSYRIMTRESGYTNYVTVYETTTNAAAYDYQLWSYGVGVTQEVAVVEMTQVGTNPIQTGTLDDIKTVTPQGDGNYWLIDPENSTKNFAVQHITDESWNEEHEVTAINLIGRGRKLDTATNFGRKGSLSGSFFPTTALTARAQRIQMEEFFLQQNNCNYYVLRSPFGDVTKLGVHDFSVTRVSGTGTTEILDWSISYSEVG